MINKMVRGVREQKGRRGCKIGREMKYLKILGQIRKFRERIGIFLGADAVC